MQGSLWRQREHRTVRYVVTVPRDELNHICSEQRHIHDVLLIVGKRPRVIGIGLRPIAQLMAPEAVFWPRGEGDIGGHSHAAHGTSMVALGVLRGQESQEAAYAK